MDATPGSQGRRRDGKPMQPTKKNSGSVRLRGRLGKPGFAESEISLRNLRIATGAMIDNSVARAGSVSHLCRLRVRARRVHQGRDRPGSSDDLDGPAGSRDAARARRRHPYLAVTHYKRLTDAGRPGAFCRASSTVADDARRLPRHLGGPRAHDGRKRSLRHRAARYRIGSICNHGACGAPAVRCQTVGADIFADRGSYHRIDHGGDGGLRIPAVPYLQAIGLEKDELVQALGLSFTVSTIALAVDVALEEELRLSIASDTIAGLALACAGMWIGQAIRLRMSPTTFRKWFFMGLMALGVYLAVRSAL